ncbi:MAG TPA: dihydroneopterin aldolase [Cyclobacteriaceae bacterium]|jgi:dihydroneopterin aldolase|nr:dihydroneopterin aldolase [Cyclobacteriaceae bacterium]
MTGKISLEGLEFHAYHGVYPHERSSGNKFEVDVIVETDIQDSAFRDDLAGTINYEDLYALVKAEMDKPSKLLETVAHSIAGVILKKFSAAKNAEVKISKFNPPIGGVCKKASVVVNRRKT